MGISVTPMSRSDIGARKERHSAFRPRAYRREGLATTLPREHAGRRLSHASVHSLFWASLSTCVLTRWGWFRTRRLNEKSR